MPSARPQRLRPGARQRQKPRQSAKLRKRSARARRISGFGSVLFCRLGSAKCYVQLPGKFWKPLIFREAEDGFSLCRLVSRTPLPRATGDFLNKCSLSLQLKWCSQAARKAKKAAQEAASASPKSRKDPAC